MSREARREHKRHATLVLTVVVAAEPGALGALVAHVVEVPRLLSGGVERREAAALGAANALSSRPRGRLRLVAPRVRTRYRPCGSQQNKDSM